MAFSRKNLDQLREQLASDIEVHTGEDAHAQGSLFASLADVWAAGWHGIYGYLDWIAKQVIDEFADDDIVLERAAAYGIYQTAAQFAAGSIQVTGNIGAVINAGAELQSQSGELYSTDAQTVLVSATATLSVTAQQAGSAGNQPQGTGLTFISPIGGINNAVTVVAPGITGGADIESVDRVRERLSERKANPPQGGSLADWKAWTKAAHQDITRVWVYPHENGIGSIVVRFVCENLPDPIPTQTHIDAVTAYINQDTIRPAGVRNWVAQAPAGIPQNFVFTSLSPYTLDVQNGIQAALADLYRIDAEPGATLLLRKLEQAVRAGGANDFQWNINADLLHTINQFPTLGSFTWP